MRRCGAHLTCNVPASFFGDVADRLGQGYHVIATCEVCGLLMGPQQSLSVAHLMGLDETGGNLTRDRGLPRLGLLAPRASWLADTAAGHPRLSGKGLPRGSMFHGPGDQGKEGMTLSVGVPSLGPFRSKAIGRTVVGRRMELDKAAATAVFALDVR